MADGWVATGIAVASAGVALWSAAWQRRTTLEKIRLDLYRRRFAIYEKALLPHQALERPAEWFSGPAFSKIHPGFIRAMRESEFLFAPESGIRQLLEDVNKGAFSVKEWKKASGKTDPTRYDIRFQAMMDGLAAADRSMEQIAKALQPYLNFQTALVLEDRGAVLRSRAWEWILSDFKVAEDAPPTRTLDPRAPRSV